MKTFNISLSHPQVFKAACGAAVMSAALGVSAQMTTPSTDATDPGPVTTSPSSPSSDARGPERSAGRYIDDKTISAKIKSSFVADDQVKALDIKVDTFNGVVQLSGFADNPAEVTRAEQIASATEGVKSVSNNIMLKSTH